MTNERTHKTDGGTGPAGQPPTASAGDASGEVEADTDQNGTAATGAGGMEPAPTDRTTLADGVATYDAATPELNSPEGEGGFDDSSRFLNRELSELVFQKRVLFEALDERNPLLERVKFLGLFTKNMDEFFMKRIGGLKQQIAAGVTETTPDGRTPEQQWEEAHEMARSMFIEQARCWNEELWGALAAEGIFVSDHDDLSGKEQADLREYFEESVLPTLTPLTFDPAHTFPFISNLSLSLAVRTKREGEEPKFSRVKIPENRPRFVQLGEDPQFVPLEQVMAANLDLLFPNVEILDYATFRVTRNAEVRRNEEVAEGLIEMIEGVLRDRRFATVVRLEVEASMSTAVRDLLVDQLGLEDHEVVERPGPLDFRDLLTLTDLNRPELQVPSWTPQHHPGLGHVEDDDADIWERIRRDDLLVHHPYHSFEKTVQSFLDAAAHDDDVLAIKAAIYRTSKESQIIESLIEAVRNGKQVAVMVELKARFDEENNLRWVRRLEEEGIHVAYGTIGLKTHSKVALVVRDEPDGVRLYSHVGTGNYHAETAKSYVDLGLLTADPAVGQDLTRVFNFFTGHSMHDDYRKLLVAPTQMREEFVARIRREAELANQGAGGRIVAKLNALEDPTLVEELYAASQAGVEIDLIVRGICRLRPGIEGLSENVRVRSVVGRFLEHSRIFYFGNGATASSEVVDGGDPEFFVGSADWMVRNLDRRVEAVVPVEDETLQDELRVVLRTMLADNRKAWEMDEEGTYVQCRPQGTEEIDTHEVLMDHAERQAPQWSRNGILDAESPLADEFDGPL
jgi:polyphosphate kinase